MRSVGVLLASVLIVGGACSNRGDTGDLSDRTVPPGSPAPDDTVDESGFRRSGGTFVNTCAVLNEAEVAAATGLTVIGSEERPDLGCSWFVDIADPDAIDDAAIYWWPLLAIQYQQQLKTADGSLDGEEIAGLGDAARYVGSETRGSVWVLLDELTFSVGTQFGFADVEGRPYQEALAHALVDALSTG